MSETPEQNENTSGGCNVRSSDLLGGAPHIDVVFDGPPSHESGRFVEVEDGHGHSIRFGEWIERDDGLWALRFPDLRKACSMLLDFALDVRQDSMDAEAVSAAVMMLHTPTLRPLWQHHPKAKLPGADEVTPNA